MNPYTPMGDIHESIESRCCVMDHSGQLVTLLLLLLLLQGIYMALSQSDQSALQYRNTIVPMNPSTPMGDIHESFKSCCCVMDHSGQLVRLLHDLRVSTS